MTNMTPEKGVYLTRKMRIILMVLKKLQVRKLRQENYEKCNVTFCSGGSVANWLLSYDSPSAKGSDGARIGTYAMLHNYISSLTSDEHKNWMALYRTIDSPRIIPPEFIEYREAYSDGFRSGYAYFTVTKVEIHRSMFGDKSASNTAYIQGWYKGQFAADVFSFRE